MDTYLAHAVAWVEPPDLCEQSLGDVPLLQSVPQNLRAVQYFVIQRIVETSATLPSNSNMVLDIRRRVYSAT